MDDCLVPLLTVKGKKMNPVKTIKEIEEKLQSYIRHTLPIERSVPDMTESLNELFKEYRMAQDPYLELMAGYETGASLRGLVEEKTIHQKTAEIFAKAFAGDAGSPEQVKLYHHQVEAIRATCRDGKNLVVCSGTGSGKTECFLIPLVNYLVGQWINENCRDRLSDGVRVMILYPMNALVNDQIRRLRGILRYAPFITFGKFTGETPQEDKVRPNLLEKIEEYANDMKKAAKEVSWEGAGFDDEAALPNEVTDRTQWGRGSAHILVTNYSMLERLLLQPQHSDLFSDRWKYIVLDEAHCYDGAQGTEIAWLMRRLQKRIGKPDHLRFMATSATLIDDPNLTEEQKAKDIQEKFASRIFPAAADSFCVQFGTPLSHSILERSYDAPQTAGGAVYSELLSHEIHGEEFKEALGEFATLVPDGERKLFSLTQHIMGAERWQKHLEKAVQLAEKREKPMAAGDMLYLLMQVSDATEAGLQLFGEQQNIDQPLFSDNDLKSLRMLVNFVKDGVGGLADLDAWREYLHDYGDSRPSSIPRGTYLANGNKFQNKTGNRLHLSTQWNDILDGKAGSLTVEGFHYLLKTAEKLSVLVGNGEDQELTSPMRIGLRFSDGRKDVLRAFVEKARQLENATTDARKVLYDAWRGKLKELSGQDPLGESIESLLAWFLGADKKIALLSNHLTDAMKNASKDAASATFEKATEKLFGEAPGARDHLDALISLGLMATHPVTSRPLVDIRYHQLFRGLTEVGVSFSDNQATVVKLHGTEQLSVETDEGSRSVFMLGVCRDCGQPFAMGYTPVEQLNQGAGSHCLRRIKTDSNKYLHAIAWRPGQEYDDAEKDFPRDQGEQVWLNIQTGQVQVGNPVPADTFWMQGYWYVAPQDNNEEFLSQCPCCGSKQHNDQNTRFGLITPYEAKGEQLKLVLLDELVRSVDPSSDPSARRHPGDGRKVLAFSDSRRGAASLAFRYQELFNDLTVGRMVPEAASALIQQPIPDKLMQIIRQSPNAAQRLQGAADADGVLINQLRPEAVENVLRRLIDGGVEVNARALQNILCDENCNRLLEVSDAAGADLTETDAARYRLLQALRKRGRYSLLRRGQIRVESNALAYARTNQVEVWNNLLAQTGIGPDQLSELCAALHLYLFDRMTITLPDGCPEQGINHPRNHKSVRRNDDNNGAIRFVSNHWRHRLNRIIRERLDLANDNTGRDNAQQVLDSLWPLFAQDVGNGNSLLVDAGSENYKLNWKDVVIRIGDVAIDVADPDPFEVYDSYLADRDIIPVRIEEHTAQLAKEKGAAYQKAFSRGLINILSCSTTFEMGVDLGDLACVFMNNLPPAPANYRQRAGRAGRRPGSAAYVLTFVGESTHERYFFDHAPELLFGRMETPKIYLENNLFRARHLRAEALHQFLMWEEKQKGWDVAGTHSDNNGNELANKVTRKWNVAGHFFVGRRVAWGGQPGNKNLKVTAVFPPLVDDLPAWKDAVEGSVNEYIGSIDQVPNDLGYSVVDDLIWQLKTQNENPVVPFELNDANNLKKYSELGGPKQPVLQDDRLVDDHENIARSDVQKRICNFYDNYNENGGGDQTNANPPGNPTPGQARVLSDETITQLTRSRVLPKYGFPVDVIQLIPHPNDPHGKGVKMERDLKIGLYEYAPGQIVMADKRVYTSESVAVFLPGGIDTALGQGRVRYLCTSCHQPHEKNEGSCTSCGADIDPQQRVVIHPDAFKSKKSIAGNGGIRPERGTPLRLYAGGASNQLKVSGLQMDTAESKTGEIEYLNFGPGYKGFGGGDDDYALIHAVKTDVAEWIPHAGLFQNGGSLAVLVGNNNRLKLAMQSALEAILKAAAIELKVVDREIGGLTHPHAAGQISFILFDESAGGGGAVLPLVLSGNPEIDAERQCKIRAIIERAVALCVDCNECNSQAAFSGLDLNLNPMSREDWLSNGQPENSRVRQSCYKCIRAYRNQRFELDRGDAVIVLRALLGESCSKVVKCYEIPDGDKFTLDPPPRGMPNGSAAKFQRIEATLDLSSTFTGLVQAADKEYITGQITPMEGALFRFLPRNSYDGISGMDIVRSDIVARLIS